MIFLSMMFGLQLFYWIVGRKASKNLKNKEDYFLAGKNVAFFPLMMTFLATQVGGGLVLGAADEAFVYGWSVLFYPIGAALGLMVLGMGIGRKLASFPVSTVAQILEIVYRSTNLRKIASVLSILSLFMILVAQIIASNKFLVSLGINNSALFIMFWAIVIVYTVQGGLKAVISTDIVQAGFFSVAFFICLIFALYINPSFSFSAPAWTTFSIGSSKLCGWLLMPLLFMVIEQDMAQRCFAGSSPRVVSKASFFAGLGTLTICVIPIFFGIYGKSLNLTIPQGASVLMTVVEKTTNPWIASLVGCAVLAAVISTATSLINAISSNLSGDFRIKLFEGKNSMRYCQMFTACISIAAIFFAFYFNNIVDLLIQSYELSVSCLFVPIFVALFKKKGNTLSAWFAIAFGSIGFCLFRFFPIAFPKEILNILLSLIGFYVGELYAFSRKEHSEIPSDADS